MVSLSHDPVPHYYALSYACGVAVATERISVNNATLAITSNLERALRYLRRSNPQVYWIDAICIHQDNTEEKLQQIRLMSNIYRRALLVCIWLGEPSAISSLGMTLIGGVKGDPYEWLCEQTLNAEFVLECAQALQGILSRPWWARLWTTQEFALATASVFVCGWDFFDSNQLVKTKTFTNIVVDLLFHGLSENSLKLLYELHLNSLNQTGIIKELCDSMWSRELEETAAIFARILVQCATRQCSDDRDRVFAMLGLCPEPVALSISADYDNTVEEVFQNLAKNLIPHLPSLLVLAMAGLGHQIEQNLPSWVPDLRVHQGNLQNTWYVDHIATSFRTTADKWWACRFEDKQLVVKGVRIGSIPAVGLGMVCRAGETFSAPTLILECRAELHRVFQSWTALCDVVTREKGAEIYHNGSTKAEAFYRTVHGDVHITVSNRGDYEVVRLQASDVQAIVQNADWVEELSRHHEEKVEEKGGRSTPYADQRRLFVTDTGYFGNGGRFIESNDQVFVIMGCQYPAILRPMDASPQCTRYRLVDTCYLHGVMEGELFDGVQFTGKPKDGETTKAYLERVEELGKRTMGPIYLC